MVVVPGSREGSKRYLLSWTYTEDKSDTSNYTMQAVALFEAKESVRSSKFEHVDESSRFKQKPSSTGGQLVEPRKKEHKEIDHAHWRKYFEAWEPDEEYFYKLL
jgi:hypothetical protein